MYLIRVNDNLRLKLSHATDALRTDVITFNLTPPSSTPLKKCTSS